MPNFSNSLLPHPTCPECGQPSTRCPGVNQLRRFNNWNDLASHLDEATIVRMINELSVIQREYYQLREQHVTKVLEAKHNREMDKALLNYAKYNLGAHTPEDLRRVADEMEVKHAGAND